MESDNKERQRFAWGLRLAWVSIVLFWFPAIFHVFGSVETGKATGLGAVAGGLSEAFMTFGLTSAVILQLAALYFLARSFRTQQATRKLLSLVSMAGSALIVLIAVAVVWLSYLR